MRTVVITGVSGQDGSILADMYLERKGFKVVGVDRWYPTGSPNLKKAEKNTKFIHETGDIRESYFIHRLFEKYKPDFFYNLAAISLVPESFRIPKICFETNTIAVLNILEEIRTFSPHTKFYQASTSEQIGENTTTPQNTDSNMLPNSPYAIAKLASYHLVRSYRNAYGLFAVNGLLWNHEGERRGPDFVTRKITKGVANIKKGKQTCITLGYLDAKRDWGYAKDFCEAMILMLHTDKPDDYAVATGESHSIREFVEEAFDCINEMITWKNHGLKEIGKNHRGEIRIRIDKKFYRPVEVPNLCGDYSKIEKELGWAPTTKFKDLVKKMVKSDLKK